MSGRVCKLVTVTFRWSSGHRIHGHEGKCKHLHGHNYRALVTCGSDHLDGLGRVMDFAMVKQALRAWIDTSWDHAMILHRNDPLAELWDDGRALGGQRLYLMDGNPTAENMAAVLAEIVTEALPERIRLVRVVLWETDDCCAEVVC